MGVYIENYHGRHMTDFRKAEAETLRRRSAPPGELSYNEWCDFKGNGLGNRIGNTDRMKRYGLYCSAYRETYRERALDKLWDSARVNKMLLHPSSSIQQYSWHDHDEVESYIKPDPPKEKPKMNLKTIAAIADENVTTIVVNFLDPDNGKPQSKEYTYKCPRLLATTLRIGLLVLVEARGAYAVARVADIHDEPDLDPEDGKDYRWAFAAVNTGQLGLLQHREDEIVSSLKKARRKTIRSQALEKAGLSNALEIAQALPPVGAGDTFENDSGEVADATD